MATLIELATFVLVARTGSFAAAAKRQGISATMVARRVSGLEDEYRTRLLERTTRTQRLTTVGEMFLERALKLLEDAEALDELKDKNEVRLAGHIRMSAPTTIGVTQIAAVIAGFTRQHPNVEIEASFSNRKVDLVGEGYDLAIRIGDPGGAGLLARKIGVYRLSCCASPTLIEQFGLPERPSDLTSWPCIINTNLSRPNGWQFRDADNRSSTVAVHGKVRMDNDETQRVLALAGVGCAYLPVDLLRADLETKRLVQLLPGWETESMPIYAVFPSRRFQPRRLEALVTAVALAVSH